MTGNAETKTFYICSMKWIYEIGFLPIQFFESVAELKRHYPDVEEFGIMEVVMKATDINRKKQ